jgi:hypothetical protein
VAGIDRADIEALEAAFDAAENDARALVSGLDAEAGRSQPEPGSWSVAECLDHLATSNRTYLAAMRPPAEAALRTGRRRRGPVRPGVLGGMFVRSLEPPVRRRTRAPRIIRPRPSPPLDHAMSAFLESQDEIRVFLRTYADIDLTGTRFPNPFIRGVRFSLATGLHVLAAHERRHLWQGWNVRRTLNNTRRPELN